MSRLARVTQKLFGSTAPAGKIGVFGSLAAGSPATTTSIATMQSLANWLGGWTAAVVGNNSPAYQDMNAVCAVLSYQLANIFQDGVPVYDSGTTYFIGSVVQYLGQYYSCKIDDTVGVDPAIGSTWQSFGGGSAGDIKATGSNIVDPGWLYCDGSSLSAATYPALAAKLFDAGTGTYAYGNPGGGFFNLPDFRGQFLRGVSDGTGRDPDAASRIIWTTGGNSGDHIGSYQSYQYQLHTHGVSDPTHNHSQNPHNHGLGGNVPYNVAGADFNVSGAPSSSSITATQNATASNNASGTGITVTNNGGNESRPRNLYVKFYIKY